MAGSVAQFGVGFRSQHYQVVTEQLPANIDLFEIISENFMGVGGRPIYFLNKLKEHYPIVMHGVGLSIGSCHELNREYLKSLKNLIDHVQPKMVSDHLCWTTYQKHNSHDLLPVAYTQQSLMNIAQKLEQIQDFIGQRFYLENPSAYVAFEYADYSEAEFLCELVKRSGAGIMLDVNNLYVNQMNQGLDPIAYLELLPRDSVGYMHLAGHSREDQVIIDTHDHPVCDEVWELYRIATQKFDRVPVIVEWDGNIPTFERLASEAEQARKLHASSVISIGAASNSAPALQQGMPVENPRLHRHFLDQMKRPYGISEEATQYLAKDLPVPAQVGMTVYNNAYFLRSNEFLTETFPSIAKLISDESFHRLTAAYLAQFPPQHPSIQELGNDLPKYLRSDAARQELEIGVELEILADIASVELARAQCFVAPDPATTIKIDDLAKIDPEKFGDCRFPIAGHFKLVRCGYEVLPVLEQLAAEQQPSRPSARSNAMLVFRKDFVIHTEALADWQADFFEALCKKQNFAQICSNIAQTMSTTDETAVFSAAAKELVRLVEAGAITQVIVDSAS
jgi:uncharacterized protein (UPF0276 family)